MTTSAWLGFGTTSTSTPRYFQLFGNASAKTTENNAQMVMPCAGTISKIRMKVAAAAGAGNAWAVRSRIAAGNGNQLLSFGEADTELQDAVNTDAVTAGALVDFSIANTGSPAATTFGFGFQFASTTADETALFGLSNGNLLTDGTTQYITLAGTSHGTTLATIQIPVPCDGTITAIYVALNAAPGAGDPVKSRTFTLLKNSDATSMAVTISTAETSGNHTSDPVSVSQAAHDKIAIQSTMANTPAACIAAVSVCFKSSTGHQFIIPVCSGLSNPNRAAASYSALCCPAPSWIADQTGIREVVPSNFTVNAIKAIIDVAPGAAKSYTFGLYEEVAGAVTPSATISGAVDVTGYNATTKDVTAGQFLENVCTPAGATPSFVKPMIAYAATYATFLEVNGISAAEVNGLAYASINGITP